MKMLNLFILIFTFLFLQNGFSDVRYIDNFTFGRADSGVNKTLTLKGANGNRQLYLDNATTQLGVTSTTFAIGDGTSGEQHLIFNQGSGSGNPSIFFDQTAGVLKFTNDGIDSQAIGSGSGAGGSAIQHLAIYPLKENDIVFNKVEKLKTITSSNQWLEIDQGGNDENISITIGRYFKNDLATGTSTYDLAKRTEDLINANANLSGFSFTYSTTTLRATISHPVNFTIKCASGEYGKLNLDLQICETFNFGIQDLSGSNSYTSSPFEFEKITTYQKTDSNKIYASTAHGIISEDVEKNNFATGLISGQKDGFSLTPGDRFYTSTTSGQLVKEALASVNSSFVGLSSDSETLAFNLSQGLVKSPSDWFATSSTFGVGDFGGEINLWDMDCNNNGYCVAIVGDTTGVGTQYYRILNKKPGQPWAATTPINIGYNGATGQVDSDNLSTQNPNFGSKCLVDENNRGILLLNRQNGSMGGRRCPWVYYSSDLNNWSAGNGGTHLYCSSTASQQGLSIAAKNEQVAVAFHDENTYTGRIYTQQWGSLSGSWTSGSISTLIHQSRYPIMLFMQYFPEQTGANKYRVVITYYGRSTSNGHYSYYKGDLSGEQTGTIFSTVTQYPASGTQDISGNKNRILMFAREGNVSKSNDDYNGGTLTFTPISGVATADSRNGLDSEDVQHLHFKRYKRAILDGNKAFYVVNSGGIKLYSTFDLSSWTNDSVGTNTGGDQEPWIDYILAENALMIGWKYNSNSLSSNTSNGQAWTRYVEILNNDLGFYNSVQIDGGKSMSSFLGWFQGQCYVDGCYTAFEVDRGAGYDFAEFNFFQ